MVSILYIVESQARESTPTHTSLVAQASLPSRSTCWLPKPVSQAVPHAGCPSQSPIRSHHWLPKPVSQAVPHAGCPSQSPKPFHMLVAQASLPSRSHHWLLKPVSHPFTSLVAQASLPSRSTCWLLKPVSMHWIIEQVIKKYTKQSKWEG